MTEEEEDEAVQRVFPDQPGLAHPGHDKNCVACRVKVELREAIAAERERCAKIVEDFWDWEYHHGDEIAREAGNVAVVDEYKSRKEIVKRIRES